MVSDKPEVVHKVQNGDSVKWNEDTIAFFAKQATEGYHIDTDLLHSIINTIEVEYIELENSFYKEVAQAMGWDENKVLELLEARRSLEPETPDSEESQPNLFTIGVSA